MSVILTRCMTWNNPLKPTATRVTHFVKGAKPAPRYGGLVPPIGPTLRAGLSAGACTQTFDSALARPINRLEPTSKSPSKLGSKLAAQPPAVAPVQLM